MNMQERRAIIGGATSLTTNPFRVEDVEGDIQQVEGKPGHHEDGHDGDEELVRAALAADALTQSFVRRARRLVRRVQLLLRRDGLRRRGRGRGRAAEAK